MDQAFYKIWVLVILIILVGGGILAWQYFETPGDKIESPEEETPGKEICLFGGKIEDNIYSEGKWTTEEIYEEDLKRTIAKQIFQYVNEPKSVIPEEVICERTETIKVSLEKIDANGDGVLEYIIAPLGIYFDEPIETKTGKETDGFSLAFANSVQFFAFGMVGEKWEFIGDLGVGTVVNLLKERTEGYFNLAVRSHVPPASCEGTIEEFAWNGEKYELIKTATFYFCSIETIPEEYLEIIPEGYYN